MTRKQALASVGGRVRFTGGVLAHDGELTKLHMNTFDDREWTARVAFDDGLTLTCCIKNLVPLPTAA